MPSHAVGRRDLTPTAKPQGADQAASVGSIVFILIVPEAGLDVLLVASGVLSLEMRKARLIQA
jgi:hypothetical protein